MKRRRVIWLLLGLALCAAAVFWICRDRSALPLDTENADSIRFTVCPQEDSNITVIDDDRVRAIVEAINDLDVGEGTGPVNRMSEHYYFLWVYIGGEDIPVELDEQTISVDGESYQADTSDLRALFTQTYDDIMRGKID